MGLLEEASVASPKRKPGEGSEWYGYYAGYSPEFVRDVLGAIAPPGEGTKRILDPWNGSGTTTAVATLQGHETVGIDRNPALVTIARARHLSLTSVEKSLEPLLSEVVTMAKGSTRRVRANSSENDELALWLSDTAVARVRALERSIYRLLVDDTAPDFPPEPISPSALSPLASFFYCSLFTVIRQLTAPFRTTNPTWIRGARNEEDRIEVGWPQIERLLLKASLALAGRLTIPASAASISCALYEGSVEDLKLAKKADVVLSSPPYCTRIDYVIATKPELAVMGHDAHDLKRLRRQMLGTPLTEEIGLSAAPKWGNAAGNFLEAVASHSSKAADTYYRRYYMAYLDGLFKSLKAIDRGTKRNGTIGLVVQDSFFKEVHFDLPKILCEMGGAIDRDYKRLDFSVSRTKAAIHPGSRSYRDSFNATESLVVFGGKGR